MKTRIAGLKPCATLLLFVALSYHVSAQVGSDRLVNAAKEARNWLTYSGGYFSQRYSLLTQITPANAKNLELKNEMAQRFMVYGIPSGVLIDRQGNLRNLQIFPSSPDGLARIETLVSEPTPKTR